MPTELGWSVSPGRKKLAQDAEAAATTLADAAAEVTVPCEAQTAGQSWSVTVPSNLATLTCDFSAGNCAAEYAEYKRKLQEWADGLQATIDVKKNEYNSHRQSCADATAAHTTSQNDNNEAVTAWENERVVCEGLHRDRNVGICVFGEKLQDKCAAKSEYDEHIRAIDAESGPESEAERENEWASMTLLKCMLKKHKNESEFDEATMASCQSDTYTVEVGTLDKKAGVVSNFLSELNCQAGPITFYNGKTCTLPGPAETVPRPTVYTCETPFTPAAALDIASPSFTFCEARA